MGRYKNLNVNLYCTKFNCRDCFQEFGTVERVKKIKDYAFIHYEDREQAVQGNAFIHSDFLSFA